MKFQTSLKCTLAAGLACLAGFSGPAHAQNPLASTNITTLDTYGPVKSSAEADATFRKALASIKAAGGGVLIIPGTAPAGWTFSNNNQTSQRIPAPPAPTREWSFSPGVTVVDTRGGTVTIHPPQFTGVRLDRTFRLPEGQSSPHWEYHPALSIQNNVVRGSTSYLDFLQDDVKKGQKRRFYLPTLRGIFPGMFINAHTGSGYSGGVQRLYVQEMGFDKERNLGYFVADTEADHAKGAIIHNKTHVNAMKMETWAHTENQTFDFMNMRHHYSQGDTYMFDARFNYMGNIHSAAGDENGVMYAAFGISESNIFRGAVQSVNAATNEVVFAPGAANAQTLGSGRPLINLNPQKWINGGTVLIVRPGSYWETAAENPAVVNPVFGGQSYPTTVAPDPRTGTPSLVMGGLIRSSADAPWTPDVVGRYFAVDEPNEHVPDATKVRRWYRINEFKQNPDGTKEIRIERFWWGAKTGGSPTLYREENYTRDGNVRPLRYIIAPGSNVYDVSRGALNPATEQPYNPAPAVGGQPPQWQRALLVTPFPQRGTALDFAPADPIEQAIGADPFHPIGFRAWTFDQVPGTFPAPLVDLQNSGAVQRASAISVAGGEKQGKPAWESVLRVDGNAGTVVDIAGEVSGAAVRIAQPTRNTPIVWHYEGGKKQASLTVDRESGVMSFDGGGLSATGLTVGGISATGTAARNLRGINEAVRAGATTHFVKFPRPEADAEYAVFLESSWLGQRAITEQKPDGFTVTFAAPAPAGARMHWTLVR